MTLAPHIPPADLTADERTVLQRYADGKKPAEIVIETGLPRELVVNTVADLAGYNPDRARQLLNGADGRPLPPAVDVFPAPPSGDETVQELFDRGERSFDAGIRSRAKRLRAKVNALAADLAAVADEQARIDADAERRRVAQDRVDALKRQLAEAMADLQGGAPPAAKPARSAAASSPTKEIRAWAARNGVECPGFGRVPKTVIAAWEAAHPDRAST